MKRLVLLLSASLMLLVGCSFDDSALWKAIEQLKAEQEEMKEQLATQQTLLNALSKKLTIKTVHEDNRGIVVTFSDGSIIIIHHGEDGKDGADGKDGVDGTSVITSVTTDDQNAYFTLSDGTVVTIPLTAGGGGNNVEPGTKNLVANPNFEEDIDLEMVGQAVVGKWSYLGGWNSGYAEVKQLNGVGVDGSRGLALFGTQGSGVDVMVGQVITGLKPGTPYKATVQVRSSNIWGGKGANICQEYIWAPASGGMLTPDNKWHTETLYIDNVPESGEVTICLRLGNTASDSQGEAYFDNVEVCVNESLYVRESNHCRLVVDKELVSVSDQVIDDWLAKLDRVYECYKELFSGRVPFEGRKFVFRSALIDAWAYAGEPIQWHQDYISQSLQRVAEGDWCFGILHEMGHNFAPYMSDATYTFDWNEELFANFRMYYAITQLGITIITDVNEPNGSGGYTYKVKTYVGDEIRALYKSDTNNCYDRIIAAGKSEEMGNALTYMLTEIVDKYGWDLWKKTFDYLYTLPRNQDQESQWSDWKRFNYLLDALNRFTTDGSDVRSAFSGGEAALAVVESYLSKIHYGYTENYALDNNLSYYDQYVSAHSASR